MEKEPGLSGHGGSPREGTAGAWSPVLCAVLSRAAADPNLMRLGQDPRQGACRGPAGGGPGRSWRWDSRCGGDGPPQDNGARTTGQACRREGCRSGLPLVMDGTFSPMTQTRGRDSPLHAAGETRSFWNLVYCFNNRHLQWKVGARLGGPAPSVYFPCSLPSFLHS